MVEEYVQIFKKIAGKVGIKEKYLLRKFKWSLNGMIKNIDGKQATSKTIKEWYKRATAINWN